MARKKDNKAALFEVLSENRGSSMKLPDWAKPSFKQPVENEHPQDSQDTTPAEEPVIEEPKPDEPQNSEPVNEPETTAVDDNEQAQQELPLVAEDEQQEVQPENEIAPPAEVAEEDVEVEEDITPETEEEPAESFNKENIEEIESTEPSVEQIAEEPVEEIKQDTLFEETQPELEKPEQEETFASDTSEADDFQPVTQDILVGDEADEYDGESEYQPEKVDIVEPEPEIAQPEQAEPQAQQVNIDTEENAEPPQSEATGYSYQPQVIDQDEPKPELTEEEAVTEEADDIVQAEPEAIEEPEQPAPVEVEEPQPPTAPVYEPTEPVSTKSYAETWPVKAPLLKADGDSLHITLSRKGFLISIAAVVVAIIIVFSLGRLSVSDSDSPQVAKDTPKTTAEAGSQTPSQQPTKAPADDSVIISQPGQRVAGRYYLVLQQLKGSTEADRTEAFRIADFCKERGWPVEVVMIGRNRMAVWSLKGLASDKSDFAKQHARDAEKLGKEYFKQYRTYDFRQRRKRDDKLSPYFIAGSLYRK